jgi:hypothetical protein
MRPVTRQGRDMKLQSKIFATALVGATLATGVLGGSASASSA